MITTPNAPVIGANFSGIWVPGAVVIGGRSGGPGIPAIDLTAQTLDSRVTYNGPAHSYIASDGTLKQSVVNEWPLEYSKGVAVGRHEPERASTNYVPGVEYGSIGQSGSVNYDWNYGPGATPVISASDMGDAVCD